MFSLPNTSEQLVREAVTCDMVVQVLDQLDNWGVKVKYQPLPCPHYCPDLPFNKVVNRRNSVGTGQVHSGVILCNFAKCGFERAQRQCPPV